jgi:hypothetical protein
MRILVLLVGLYVTRQTPLHLGAPDGPQIGVAYTGAYLVIEAAGPVVTKVRVADFEDGNGRPLAAYVATADLGPAATAEEPPPLPPGRMVRNYESWLRVPRGLGFAMTRCDPFLVLGWDGVMSRVIQRRGLVELRGVVSHQVERERGPCLRGARPQDANAGGPDWRWVDHPQVWDVLRTVARRAGSVFIPAVEHGARVCAEWRFRPSRATADLGTFESIGTRTPIRWAYALSNLNLVLLGPNGAGCGAHTRMVARRGDVLDVLPGASTQHKYWADDVEHWYLTRDACEAAPVPLAFVAATLGC